MTHEASKLRAAPAQQAHTGGREGRHKLAQPDAPGAAGPAGQPEPDGGGSGGRWGQAAAAGAVQAEMRQVMINPLRPAKVLACGRSPSTTLHSSTGHP
ncbi:hypothetical protein HaLaN_07753 [Haematococcus lacustris]|uniref:Uncharacterized protein n=1 Tax=Haematococcus lacustris TaxID=44745 RepID=A0A699YRB4_HAELA|nr:hypothetical protein HaLaN_07753 [Haematococcus lacustris]